MMAYQKLSGEVQFTAYQVDSLTAGEIFSNYAWWEEFDINITNFEDGVKKMVDFMSSQDG
jgi:hypothetical protein